MPETLADIARGDPDAMETIRRWAYPEFSHPMASLGNHPVLWQKRRLIGRWACWVGRWDGPMGGHHKTVGLTKRAVRRKIRDEMGMWTRHLRRRRSLKALPW